MEMNYIWFAKYENGDVLWEVDSDGNEHHWGHVQDKITNSNKLVQFGLKNHKTGKEYLVDFRSGIFGIQMPDSQLTEVMKLERVSDCDVTYKPIYFKRRRAKTTIGVDGIEQGCVHCIGFETTSDKFSFEKFILKVDDEHDNAFTLSVE